MAKERRPLRTVTNDLLVSGRGSVLGPDTNRRTRWYELDLDCGHKVERDVKYAPLTQERFEDGEKPTQRRADAALPAPKRARCDYCPKVDA